MKIRLRKGQTMTEYILVFAALLGVIAVSGFLLSAVVRTVERTESLVGSDYP